MVRFAKFGVPAVVILVAGAGLVAAGGSNHSPSVCDDAGLVGSAYAACHVYCEALDCDASEPNGSERACGRALDRFEYLTNDALPPCEIPEGVVCPCSSAWNAPGFFPENPTTADCLFEDGGDQFSKLHVWVADDFAGTRAEATLTLVRFDDPGQPFFSVDCSSRQFPGDENPALSGAFAMVNLYPSDSGDAHSTQESLFASCETALMNVVQRFQLQCGGEGP